MRRSLSGVVLLVAGMSLAAACTTGGSTAPASSASALPSPVITKPVPAPVGRTGPPVIAVTALPPVPVGKSADFGGGLVATVSSISDIPKLVANGPGEIAGPGVSVTIDVHNASNAPIDLSGIDVNASYRGGTPADTNQSSPAAPLKGTLASGEDQKGVYVFQVPTAESTSVQVQIAWIGSPNVVLVQR